MSAEDKPNGWIDARHGMPQTGDTAARRLDISARHIEPFTAMRGDRNPLHTDREDKPFCPLRTTVENQQGEVCVSGDAVTDTTPLPQ